MANGFNEQTKKPTNNFGKKERIENVDKNSSQSKSSTPLSNFDKTYIPTDKDKGIYIDKEPPPKEFEMQTTKQREELNKQTDESVKEGFERVEEKSDKIEEKIGAHEVVKTADAKAKNKGRFNDFLSALEGIAKRFFENNNHSFQKG